MSAAAITTPAVESSSQRFEREEAGATAASETGPEAAAAEPLPEANLAGPDPEATVGAGGTWIPESEAMGTLPEGAAADVPELDRPDSVSRFSRCRSVRSSAALW